MGQNTPKKQLNIRVSVDDLQRWDELLQITLLSAGQLMSQLIRSLHYVAWSELVRIGIVSNQKFVDLETGGKIIKTRIMVRKCPKTQAKLKI